MSISKCNILFLSCIIATPFSCCKEAQPTEGADYADFAHVVAKYIVNADGSRSDIEEEIAKHPKAFSAMAKVSGFDTADVDSWLTMPSVKAFAADIDSISPSSQQMKQMLSKITDNANTEGVDLPVNSFASVIWGKPQSIIFCDSCMLIALNHYLGSEHPAYGSLDSYHRQVKSVDILPYDIAEALVATQYPFVKKEGTSLINRLLYEGALIEAKMRMVDDSSLSDALGYTDQQLKQLNDNEAEIWAKMVGSKMLFDTSASLAERFVAPAPFTAPLSPEIPGRAGRYVGYKLIKSYMEANPGTQLKDILAPEFYNADNPLTNIPYSAGLRR